MALFVRGSLCYLCGQPMNKRKEVIIFPHLVNNTHEPLFLFNGRVFHKHCVYAHAWGKTAIRQKQYVHESILPKRVKTCDLCGTKITDDTQVIDTGILTLDEKHPLYTYNWLEAHNRCMAHWHELPVLVHELERFIKAGKWKDVYPEFRPLEALMATLKGYVPGRAKAC